MAESVHPSVPLVRTTRPPRPETDATSTLAAGTPPPPPSRRRVPLLLGVGTLALAGLVYAGARPRSRAHVEEGPVRSALVVTSDEAAPPAPPSPEIPGATTETPPPPPSVASARVQAVVPRRTGITTAPAVDAPASAAVSAPVPAAPPETAAPVVPIAPPPPPVVTAAVAPPPPSYQPDRAAAILTVADVAGTSRKTVAALIGHVNVTDCYQGALRALGRPEGGQGTVHLDIDEDGVVTAVTVKLPPALAEASACIRTRLLRQRLGRPPDTGSASSELAIQLTP